MEEYEDDSDYGDGSELIRRVDKVLDIDGRQLRLPADAPDGHPHILTSIDRLRGWILDYAGAPAGFSPVDTIATTLFIWKPEAVLNLLDMSNTHMSWISYSNNYAIYIVRNGRQVRAGSLEIGPGVPPDFEIRYSIDQDGKWKLIMQSEFGRVVPTNQWDSREYDGFFARHLIIDEKWQRPPSGQIYYKDDQKLYYEGKESDEESKEAKDGKEQSVAEEKTGEDRNIADAEHEEGHGWLLHEVMFSTRTIYV